MNTEQINRHQFIKDNVEVQLDNNKLIKEAKWKVRYNEGEVIRCYQELELAKLALKQLENGLDYEPQLQYVFSGLL